MYAEALVRYDAVVTSDITGSGHHSARSRRNLKSLSLHAKSHTAARSSHIAMDDCSLTVTPVEGSNS